MDDSEIITLVLVMDYLPFPGETQFLAFIRANYHQWFPHLLTQSQLIQSTFTKISSYPRKFTSLVGYQIRSD